MATSTTSAPGERAMTPRRSTRIGPASAVLMALAVLILQALTLVPAQANSDPHGAHERWAFCKINEERRARGLAPLAWDTSLQNSARNWSANMRNEGALRHNPNVTGEATRADPNWTSASENVGFDVSADGLHRAFMNSTSHRDNILRGSSNRAGVGVAFGTDGRLWVTQLFIGGTPLSNPDTCASGAGPVPAMPNPPPANPPSNPPPSNPPPSNPPPSNSSGFSDVPDGAFFTRAVEWAVDQDIATGTSPTTFSPHNPVTRGQIAAFLWRGADRPPASGPQFSDVPAGAFYADAVRWMRATELTAGCAPDRYCPNAQASRAELVTLLWRSVGSPDMGTNHGFSDVPRGSFYERAVTWAVRTGTTTGSGPSTFSPNASVTRAQTVTFMWRIAGQP